MLRGGTNDALLSVMELLPRRIALPIERCSADNVIEEVRLRASLPVQLVFADDEMLLEAAAFSADEAKELLERLCRHSVYAYAEELRSGFITLESGARVGVCGRPTVENGSILNLTRVYGFNIRIPRQVIGCAEEIMRFVCDERGPVSTLIAAPPGGGKTTILRDVARCFSDGLGCRPIKVAVADERGELAACSMGAPRFDLGKRTDVMDRAPKAASIEMMIRSMSPQVIITDEIGGKEDSKAVSEAARCGCAVIASAHAASMEELLSRECTGGLLRERVFKKVLLLSRKGSRLRVAQVTV